MPTEDNKYYQPELELTHMTSATIFPSQEEVDAVKNDIKFQLQEDEDDTEDEIVIDTNFQYEQPEAKKVFVDTANGQVLDEKQLTPFQMIKAIAKQTGTQIKDPNPSCRHCYGRGYIGVELKTQVPIPCGCIYRGKTDNTKMMEELYDKNKVNSFHLNRKQRRNLKKIVKKKTY